MAARCASHCAQLSQGFEKVVRKGSLRLKTNNGWSSSRGHRAQLMSLRTYVHGVFSDSERKSMQAMLARVTEPVAYQAFHHFITHAPWDADGVWRRLRAVVPEQSSTTDLTTSN
jgi:SRSO17 transposase